MQKKMYELEYNAISFNDRVIYNSGLLKIPYNGISLLIGKSGVGKSTLIKQIFYNYGASCVLVSQDNNLLISNISVIDNICFFDFSKMNDAISLLQELKFDYILDRNIKHLSGGEKRIVLVLRAFLSDNPILLIDEPTNNLDCNKVLKLKKLLVLMAKKKTIFIVTHDDRFLDIADSIWEIKNKNLLTNFEYAGYEVIEVTNMISPKISINKFFKRPIINYLLLFIFTMVFIASFIFLYTIKNKTIDNINNNQVDITSTLYQNHNNLISKGYLPTKLLINIFDDADYRNIIKDIESCKNDVYSLNLEVPENENYRVFELQIIDLKHDLKYFILNIYWDVYYNLYGEYPNISELIDVDITLLDGLKSSDTVSSIDEEIYLAIVQQIKASISPEDMQKVYYTIVYDKNTSFKEIILSNDFKNITSANYYIRSNETIALYNNIIIQTALLELYFLLILVSIIIIVFMIINLYIDLKLNKNAFIGLRNYGVDEQEVEKVFSNNNCSIFIRLLGILSVFISNFSFWLLFNIKNYQLFWIFFIYFIAIILYGYFKKIIIRHHNKKINTFGGIYDEI